MNSSKVSQCGRHSDGAELIARTICRTLFTRCVGNGVGNIDCLISFGGNNKGAQHGLTSCNVDLCHNQSYIRHLYISVTIDIIHHRLCKSLLDKTTKRYLIGERLI